MHLDPSLADSCNASHLSSYIFVFLNLFSFIFLFIFIFKKENDNFKELKIRL
jgi:hypothetical protein